jgi:hypothetical protein
VLTVLLFMTLACGATLGAGLWLCALNIIAVEHLGKSYRIRHQQAWQLYVALCDVIAEKPTRVARRLQSVLRASPFRLVQGDGQNKMMHPSTVDEFWAL